MCREQPTGPPEWRSQAERAISTGKLNALRRLHARPINLVVFEGPSGRTHLGGRFPLRCFQRLSLPDIATQRLPLAGQLAHQRSVQPDPLVLGSTLLNPPPPTTDRDRPGSRRSKPSSRTAIDRRTAEPLGPSPAPGCDEPTSRCQTSSPLWTLRGDQPVIPGVPFIC
jgi:hypothetical protein